MCAGLGPTPCSAPVACDGGQGCHAEIMLLGAALPCCARLATQHSLTTRALPADRLPPIAGAGQGELDRARASRDSPPRATQRRATLAGRMSASRTTSDVARGLTFRTDWPIDRALKWPRCAGAARCLPMHARHGSLRRDREAEPGSLAAPASPSCAHCQPARPRTPLERPPARGASHRPPRRCAACRSAQLLLDEQLDSPLPCRAQVLPHLARAPARTCSA